MLSRRHLIPFFLGSLTVILFFQNCSSMSSSSGGGSLPADLTDLSDEKVRCLAAQSLGGEDGYRFDGDRVLFLGINIPLTYRYRS
ncbi:MAG: hypothetical protein AAF203_11265 [Pseudomonadota bacterium]